MPDSQSNKPTFEIALVMAGAVSAGSYTAGVLDFLFEALDRWYKRFHSNPPHNVKIKVMTGTSAGGMCTGISALQFIDKSDYLIPNSSKLYNSWVKMVDIGPMLTSTDLTSGKAYSILNSDIIDTISDKAFDMSCSYTNMPLFVTDSLHIVLTVTNTRGVSYSIDFEAEEGKSQYVVSNFGDYFHFQIRKPQCTDASPDPMFQSPLSLDPAQPGTTNWNILKEMCKATGAFPIGLRARLLPQPNTQLYGLRFPPSVPVNIPKGKDYSFIGIDGGMINNEPFKLAHDILAGGVGKKNKRDPDKADKAVIMVDPFPSSPVSLDYDHEATDLASVTGAFIKSLMGQAMFNPNDLQLSFQSDIRSRFLISPIRSNPKGKDKEKYHVAGGALGAFSGFLHESYRSHDYILGRRNCQHFLRKYFTLDKKNPLFENWTSTDIKEVHEKYESSLKENELPILPLASEQWEEIQEPHWPTISQAEYEKKVKKKLYTRVRDLGNIFISNAVLKKTWSWWLHKMVANKVSGVFEKELGKAELLK